MRSDTSSVGPGIDGAFGAGSSGGFVVADLKAASAESREPIGGRYRPGVLAIATPSFPSAGAPPQARLSLASGRLRINAEPGRRNASAPSAFPFQPTEGGRCGADRPVQLPQDPDGKSRAPARGGRQSLVALPETNEAALARCQPHGLGEARAAPAHRSPPETQLPGSELQARGARSG